MGSPSTPPPPPRTRSNLNVSPISPLGQLIALLERYVAPLTVESMVRRSLDRLQMQVGGVTPRNLERVVEEVMVGLRLFCEERKLPQLMLELAELVHGMPR